MSLPLLLPTTLVLELRHYRLLLLLPVLVEGVVRAYLQGCFEIVNHNFFLLD